MLSKTPPIPSSTSYANVFSDRTLGDASPPSAFLLPSTGSGVLLGVPSSRSLVASAWQLAWYALPLTSTASSHTHSCAVSSHVFSNRSWQIGHTLLIPLFGSGTAMYLGLAASAAALDASAALVSAAAVWSASTDSLDLLHSCPLLVDITPFLSRTTYMDRVLKTYL